MANPVYGVKVFDGTLLKQFTVTADGDDAAGELTVTTPRAS
jgi:hypothetical protein